MAFIHGRDAIQRLIDAGVLPDSPDIRRVEIVMELDDALHMNVDYVLPVSALETVIKIAQDTRALESA